MTNRVSFYGDASLPHYDHRGHFAYGPEVRGIPGYGAAEIPRELWGEGYPNQTPRDREYHRRFDHRQLLPWVLLRPEDKPCGQSRDEGEGAGTARLTYTANHTVLACWDYTGDARGGCYSMFWIKGRLSANDMVEAIKKDFPLIWTRITAGGGLMEVWGDDPPPMATVVDVVAVANVVAPKAELAPVYDLSVPDEFFAKAEPQLLQIVEDVVPAVGERLRHASARR